LTTMQQVLIFATILVPVITALTELVKRTVVLSVNYIPAISFILGLVIGAVGYLFTDLQLDARLWAGGLAGLSAVGLYEVFVQRPGTTKK